MIKITFPDGTVREFEKGVDIQSIAGSISSGLKKSSIAGYVNDELFDLNREINEDSTVKIITKKDKEAIEILNHSSAHLLAAAVKNLYPNAIFGVGPAIEEGFYYDIDTQGEMITESDLTKIEKEMQKLASRQIEMTRSELTRGDALVLFEHDKYKLELIKSIPEGEKISVYKTLDFTDLCRGGHVGNLKNIKHFKLISIAGAYWRGDSNNAQLQRIYGTSFFTKDDLAKHLEILKERKERDHRKLGKELEIFEINPEFGQGLALWLPNGYTVRKVLEDYVYNLERRHGYSHISTPAIGNKKLYETSGHWCHYNENMFPIMERANEEMVLRPMSCPHHMLVYKTKLRSYRDLPIRYSETVLQHRYEASGALTGLERVRAMTLTDAHLFVRKDQIKEEVKNAFKLVNKAVEDLGLEIDYVELALREPGSDKYHDDDTLWNEAEDTLRDILNELGVKYVEMEGEAAFYGPKIDIQVRTAMNRLITMSTIQLDFLLPIKFDLEYIEAGGEKERPVVIHRGLISTYERLMSILLEQYKGAFPLWLAPQQINIIPVSLEAHKEYADKIYEELFDMDLRVKQDLREEKMGYKIRESQKSKIPYTLVLGDNEVEKEEVTFRAFGSREQTTVSFKEFKDMILKEIKLKKKIS